jgi:hypothetical protein
MIYCTYRCLYHSILLFLFEPYSPEKDEAYYQTTFIKWVTRQNTNFGAK